MTLLVCNNCAQFEMYNFGIYSKIVIDPTKELPVKHLNGTVMMTE